MSTEGMSLFHEMDRVKERRRERVERIRMQPRDSYSPFVDDWKDPIDPQEELFSFSNRDRFANEQRPVNEKWGIQIILSLFLVGMAYVIFQTTLIPFAWKDSAREVMTREFNFSGVADWYEAKFGTIPTLLPSFTGPTAAVPATTGGNAPVWKLPAHWKVVKAYEPTSAKVILTTGISDQITIGETGWVAYVGEKPGYGTTVVVRLTQGREVWFGNLDGVRVTKDEVLHPGQVVGTARSVNHSARHLYLGYSINDEFVNPLEVIPFE
jgi:stage IV sporulation protein FA